MRHKVEIRHRSGHAVRLHHPLRPVLGSGSAARVVRRLPDLEYDGIALPPSAEVGVQWSHEREPVRNVGKCKPTPAANKGDKGGAAFQRRPHKLSREWTHA